MQRKDVKNRKRLDVKGAGRVWKRGENPLERLRYRRKELRIFKLQGEEELQEELKFIQKHKEQRGKKRMKVAVIVDKYK